MINGKDGQVRGVKLRVFKDGKVTYVKRPIQILIPFEISDENEHETHSQHETNELETQQENNGNHLSVSSQRPKRLADLVNE